MQAAGQPLPPAARWRAHGAHRRACRTKAAPTDFPTPLVPLRRLGSSCGGGSNRILLKLEGCSTSGSVHERPAASMIAETEKAGTIAPGSSLLIEAAHGSAAVALATAAARSGYTMRAIVPKSLRSPGAAAALTALGAEVVECSGGLEEARALAKSMAAAGDGTWLDQMGNPNNPLAHLRGTGPELWAQTEGRLTHVVCAMGSTSGTIMGISAYLKALNPELQVVGVQPDAASSVPGWERWTKDSTAPLWQAWRVDQMMQVTRHQAECTARVLARSEGVLAGVSSGAAVAAALALSATVEDAVIAVVVCDRGEASLEAGIFSKDAGKADPRPVPPPGFWPAVQCLVAPRAFPGPHFVLFIASKDPVTGRPWCPDCEDVAGRVEQAVAQSGGTLLCVHVGSEAEWQDPGHPLRTHPSLRLRYVPTLVEWTAEGPKRRAAGEWAALQALISTVGAAQPRGPATPRQASPPSTARQASPAGTARQASPPSTPRQASPAGTARQASPASTARQASPPGTAGQQPSPPSARQPSTSPTPSARQPSSSPDPWAVPPDPWSPTTPSSRSPSPARARATHARPSPSPPPRAQSPGGAWPAQQQGEQQAGAAGEEGSSSSSSRAGTPGEQQQWGTPLREWAVRDVRSFGGGGTPAPPPAVPRQPPPPVRRAVPFTPAPTSSWGKPPGSDEAGAGAADGQQAAGPGEGAPAGSTGGGDGAPASGLAEPAAGQAADGERAGA